MNTPTPLVLALAGAALAVIGGVVGAGGTRRTRAREHDARQAYEIERQMIRNELVWTPRIPRQTTARLVGHDRIAGGPSEETGSNSF